MPKTVAAGPLSNVDTQHVTFSFTDGHGRSIGYLITTSEIDMVPATDDRQSTFGVTWYE